MRLVTRGDLDGLTASVLISEMEDIEEIVLVHPQDITDNKFEIQSGDILANLPYDPRCAMWFDHHAHTIMPENDYRGAYKVAPSVARVIFEHYASPKLTRFEHLVTETDRFDSADLTPEDVSNPQGIILLGFLVDPRTGFKGDFHSLFLNLVEQLRMRPVEEVLKDPEIDGKTRYFNQDHERFRDFLQIHSRMHDKVVVTDFRDIDTPPVGNRFLVYSVFPDCNVSLRIQWGPQKKFVAINIGHSIFDKSCNIDVGELCRNYGGGGHKGAGGCVLSPMAAALSIKIITEKLRKN